MDRRGYKQCVPRADDPELRPEPLLGLTSGYVQRGSSLFPKQGSKAPWLLRQNYILDLMTMRFGAVDDGALVFSNGGDKAAPCTPRRSRETDAEAATASA